MLVVADSTVFVVLIEIGHIEILPSLFKQVWVPREIIEETRHPDRPAAVRAFAEVIPSWLIVRSPKHLEQIASLHAGELAAISLARELRADLLLIDERAGRAAAQQMHIPITGTIGVLELAADAGLLDLSDAFARMKRTDFWISHRLLDERLRRRENQK